MFTNKDMRKNIFVPILIGIIASLILALWFSNYKFAPSIFFIIVFLLIAFLPPVLKIITHKFDPLETENLFIIFFILYSIILSIKIISREPILISSISSISIIPGETIIGKEFILIIYLWTCLLALIFFYLGYYSRFTQIIGKKLPHFNYINNDRLILGGTFFICFGFLLVSLLIKSAGGLQNYFLIGYGRAGQLFWEGKGFLGYGFSFINIGILTLLISSLNKRKIHLSPKWILIILSSIFILTTHFLMGRRLEILSFCVMLLITYHYGLKKITLKRAVMIVILLFLFAAAFGWGRGIFSRGLMSTKEFGKTLKTAIKEFPLERLNPLKIGEFDVPPLSLWELIERGPKNIPLAFGSTYIKSLGVIIPKAIWPTRPETLDQWRLKTFYPELIGTGEGLAFFTVTEGFLNFGFLGVAIHMFIYGAIAKIIYIYLRQNPQNKANLLFYAFMAIFVFTALRSDIVPVLKKASLEYLIPWLVLFMYAQRPALIKEKGVKFIKSTNP